MGDSLEKRVRSIEEDATLQDEQKEFLFFETNNLHERLVRLSANYRYDQELNSEQIRSLFEKLRGLDTALNLSELKHRRSEEKITRLEKQLNILKNIITLLVKEKGPQESSNEPEGRK